MKISHDINTVFDCNVEIRMNGKINNFTENRRRHSIVTSSMYFGNKRMPLFFNSSILCI